MLLGRLLIGLALVILLLSPITECVQSFDAFPEAGQDLEPELLLVVALLCLVLLVTLLAERLVQDRSPAPERRCSEDLPQGQPALGFCGGVIWVPPRDMQPAKFALPLRI